EGGVDLVIAGLELGDLDLEGVATLGASGGLGDLTAVGEERDALAALGGAALVAGDAAGAELILEGQLGLLDGELDGGGGVDVERDAGDRRVVGLVAGEAGLGALAAEAAEVLAAEADGGAAAGVGDEIGRRAAQREV